MEILRRLPTDGLIKREGPLSRLKGSVMFIIAMMNATDRWPLSSLMERKGFRALLSDKAARYPSGVRFGHGGCSCR